MDELRDLGLYSDWAKTVIASNGAYPVAKPGQATKNLLKEALAFDPPFPENLDIRTERQWEHDGIVGEAISWNVGYGPRSVAWLLKPAGVTEPLPGALALHGHGIFKYFGKEKVADDDHMPHRTVVQSRAKSNGGVAYANRLAKLGFAVIVPDSFLWSSRRFPIQTMQTALGNWSQETKLPEGEIERYNAVAKQHEHLIAKYCQVMGTSLGGVIAYEDRLALHVLRSRPDVISDKIAAVGLSGGGCRTVYLNALENIQAAVVVGMMSTYESLLDRMVDVHSWMFFPNGIARHADWSDLAACNAPSPLMVQYCRHDPLFTIEGMEAAHARIGQHYADAGHADAYIGEFYDGGHRFGVEMQDAAFAWIAQQLR